MHSTQESTRPGPQHTLFDTDAHKFLINSGASTHMWDQRKDFQTYKQFSKEDQKKEQVLGISSDMIQPLGVGTIHVQIEDNLNAKHMIKLHDVMHMPDTPINILVPQVFIQQCKKGGERDAAFECIAEQRSVHICRYHCDNGCFADRAFMDDVHQAHQTITFCGVGAHH